MKTFQITAAIVSVCAAACLILFVILLKDIDPAPLDNIINASHTILNFPPEILRRSRDDLHMANITHEAMEEDLNLDRIVEEIVSSSLAELNNSNGENIVELSNSILMRLRGKLLNDIKQALPKIIQVEDEVAKVNAKINTNVSDNSFVASDDAVVINITDSLGQPLVELKLYSYRSSKAASKDEDLILD